VPGGIARVLYGVFAGLHAIRRLMHVDIFISHCGMQELLHEVCTVKPRVCTPRCLLQRYTM